jgi:hypothetical protein
MLRPFDKTIYVYRSGKRVPGIPNHLTAEQLAQVFGPGEWDAEKVKIARPWLIAYKTALTLDSSGSNLPSSDPPWEFRDEVQPTEVISMPFDGEERAYRALTEKGWFITRLVHGVSSGPSESPDDSDAKLSHAGQQLLKDINKRGK